METILIPRVSVFTTDTEIFTNLHKFSSITGYTPHPLPLVSQQTTKTAKDIFKQTATGFTNVFGKIQRAALNRTRGDYEILEDNEMCNTLFSEELQNSWRHEKKKLVELIAWHEATIRSMQKSQENIEETLQERSSMHDRDYKHYQKLVLKEINYREKIDRLAFSLQSDIENKMKEAIRHMMKVNKQQTFNVDEQKMAQQLYKYTCRTYRYQFPTLEPCFPERIQTPVYGDSLLHKKDIHNVQTQIKDSRVEQVDRRWRRNRWGRTRRMTRIDGMME